LESLGRKSKGEATPKVDKIIELYRLRKISQRETASNVILKLISKDPKEQKKGFKDADNIIEKHREVATLSHRLRAKTTVRIENQVIKSISVGDDKKAKTDIKININSNKRADHKHSDFEFIYGTIKNKIHQETEKMLKIKKQMKIQTVIHYRIKKMIAREEVGKGDYKIEGDETWKYRDVINNTKAEGISSNNMREVLAKQKDNLQKQINDQNDSWQVDVFYYLIISCYSVKPPRASSYIPTPAPYNNPKCGLVNIQNKDNLCFQWCMKYHQTNQAKHDDRTTVLNKTEDK